MLTGAATLFTYETAGAEYEAGYCAVGYTDWPAEYTDWPPVNTDWAAGYALCPAEYTEGAEKAE